MAFNKTNKGQAKNDPKESDLSDFLFGKLPPQALALEEAVLGGLILDTDAQLDYLGTIDHKWFYSATNALICQILKSMHLEGNPIDLLTICQEISKRKLTTELPPHKIMELTNKVVGTANLERHLNIIKQQYMGRSLIANSTEIIRGVYENEDPFDLLNKNTALEERLLNEIKGDVAPKSVKDSIRSLLHGERKLLSLTGIDSLDAALGFIEGTGVFGICTAAPGVGKSVLQNNLFIYGFVYKMPQMHISFETQQEQLVLKAIAGILGGDIYDNINGSFGVSYQKIRRGVSGAQGYEGKKYLNDSDTEKVLHLVDAIESDSNPCKLVYMAAPKLDTLLSIIRRNAKKGAKVFTIDRAELIDCSKEVSEYSQIFSRLRAIAVELGIVIFLFAQQSGSGRGGMEILHASEARNSAQFLLMIERDGENEAGVPTPVKLKLWKNSLGADGLVDGTLLAHYDRQIIWNGEIPATLENRANQELPNFAIKKPVTGFDCDDTPF